MRILCEHIPDYRTLYVPEMKVSVLILLTWSQLKDVIEFQVPDVHLPVL